MSELTDDQLTDFRGLMWGSLPNIQPILTREYELRCKTSEDTGKDFVLSPAKWGAVLKWHIVNRTIDMKQPDIESEFNELYRRIDIMQGRIDE